MRNLITDVPGLLVGNAHDERIVSGVTALVFETPAVASVAIHGGAPGVRDAALLEPEASVEAVDALVLSGGSAFGLDSMGGAMAHLRSVGRGFEIGPVRVPIVPGAIVFDLLAAGARDWGDSPPWWTLGRQAAANAARDFALGSAGAGYGATTVDVKGGLGSASVQTGDGFIVGALVVVNAVGTTLVDGGPHFWAAPDELDGEFGGLGFPARNGAAARAPQPIKGDRPRENTTIAIVATDAALTKSQCKRMAIMAHDGLARAIRPSHAPMDGDVVFAAATARAGRAADLRQLAALGDAAAACLARACARAIFEASALPFPGALPSWRDRFGG
ncbi:MAG: P1 family peptidase [Beijerinckiaceae bacterium]|nr:P1 family peptidase [Beijerinckiaceae bacterium]